MLLSVLRSADIALYSYLMNLKLSYFSFVCNVLFFLLGCSVSTVLFTLEGRRGSETSTGELHKPRVDLIILIMSGPGNRAQRDAVRSSWLEMIPKSHSAAHFFAVGEEGLTDRERSMLISEHGDHGDLVLLPLVDSYSNLSVKLALSLQAVTHLYTFTYLLKLDDDTFLHYYRLQEELKKIGSESLYWGYFSPSAHVFRSGRWKESGWYLCDRYLPYALGGGYLIAYSLASFISDNHHLFKKYSSEDVSMGVWLSAVSTQRVHDIRFDTQSKTRGCWNDQIVKHKIGTREMVQIADRLRRGDEICEKEFSSELRPYSYDWAKKPSQCCQSVDPADHTFSRTYISP